MEIKSAEFIMSNSNVAHCPGNKIPEYAFIGRSNVGKSSLINMLVQKKSIAKTSGKPGKTQLINHFLINKNWYLVDLPGYGYAKISKQGKNTIQKIIRQYFAKRLQLVLAFVLIDSRHEPQKLDLDFMTWLGKSGIPFAIIFTKADKLNPKTLEINIERYKTSMLEDWEEMLDYFITSSTNGTGRAEVLNYIESINSNLD